MLLYESRLGEWEMAKNKLSIYLIKEGILENSDIFKNELTALQEFNENKIAYYVRSNSHQPTWLNNFFDITDATLFQANMIGFLKL